MKYLTTKFSKNDYRMVWTGQLNLPSGKEVAGWWLFKGNEKVSYYGEGPFSKSYGEVLLKDAVNFIETFKGEK